jgi:phosphatidylglycerophosphate synthase
MLTKIRDIARGIGNINENPRLIRFRSNLTQPLAKVVSKLGISPTTLNLIGLSLGIIAGLLVGSGNFRLASIFFISSLLADVLDGAVARYRNVVSDFGKYFDSICDRYVDMAVLSGIAWYYFQVDKSLALLTLISIIGASVSGFAKVHAEALSAPNRYLGFFNRPERVIALVIGLLFPGTLDVVLWIMAILSNVTAIHRFAFYSLELRKR